LVNNNIVGYFRYVDDILIVYNPSTTDIYHVFNPFNNLKPTIKFTIKKDDNGINFLELTIQKDNNNLSFNVYRKPTTTVTIIPRDSCYQQEHKHAGIRYLVNRINTYELNPTKKI
jgi:hypothetical protein